MTIVVYELVTTTYSSNLNNRTIETTKITSVSRFWRPLSEFMGEVVDRDGIKRLRFELVPSDMDEDVWEQNLALCEN